MDTSLPHRRRKDRPLPLSHPRDPPRGSHPRDRGVESRVQGRGSLLRARLSLALPTLHAAAQPIDLSSLPFWHGRHPLARETKVSAEEDLKLSLRSMLGFDAVAYVIRTPESDGKPIARQDDLNEAGCVGAVL